MISTARGFLTRPPTGTPRRALSPGEGLPVRQPQFKGVAKAALYCAHRTSTVSPCAFCEQEGRLAALSSHLSELVFPPHEGVLDRSLTARIEGAHPIRAHSASERDRPAVPPLPFSCFRACFYFSLEGGLFGLPLRATFSPAPTGTPRRAISPGEGLPILYTAI